MPIRPPPAPPSLPTPTARRGQNRGQKLRVLLIGGTAEAADLTRLLAARGADAPEVTVALVPPIERSGPLPAEIRIGGFARVTELISFLLERNIDALVDASHPFAPRIAEMATAAAEAVGMPRLVMVRPNWRRHPLDRWIEVMDRRGASRILPRVGKRIYLADGWSDLDLFAGQPDRFFLARRWTDPAQPLALDSHVMVLGRPGNMVEEALLLRRHAIDGVVLHAAGGAEVEPVIAAARAASLPIVMIRRPLPASGRRADAAIDAADWVASLTEPERNPLPE